MSEIEHEAGPEYEERALSMPDQARAILVTDPESYARAGTFLVAIKGLREEIRSHHAETIEAAHRAHKAALAAKKRLDEPLEEAERIVKRSIGAYQEAEERKRREAEAQLRAEARRIEEEARMQEALALEAAGQKEEAERVIEAPAFVPAISVAPATPKVQGVSTRKRWAFRITDPNAIPREYLAIDATRIRKIVEAMGEATKIPGVEVFPETIVAASGR